MEFTNLKDFFGVGIEAAPDVMAAINEKNIKSVELGITPRVLNHWKNQGLFLAPVAEDRHQHTRFSFVDYVWFSLIEELRKFNLSLNSIRKIKECLFTSIPLKEFMKYPAFIEEVLSRVPDEAREEVLNYLHSPDILEDFEKNIQLNMLPIFLIRAIVSKEFIAIYANNAGDVLPIVYNEYEKVLTHPVFQEFIKNSFVSVSLSDIITKYIANVELSLSCRKFLLLTEREAEIIKILRDKRVVSLNVYKKPDDENPIKLIEIEERNDKVGLETRLLDLIFKNGYQSIEIKTQDGRVTYCKNTRKMKFE